MECRSGVEHHLCRICELRCRCLWIDVCHVVFCVNQSTVEFFIFSFLWDFPQRRHVRAGSIDSISWLGVNVVVLFECVGSVDSER